MSLTPTEAKHRLYDAFLLRIRTDWTDTYATDFPGAASDHFHNSALHRAIFEEVRRKLRTVPGVKSPSADTIGRMLSRGEFAPNVQERTLTGFAYYLTGADFDAFRQQPPPPPSLSVASAPVPKPEPVEAAVEQPVSVAAPAPNRRHQRWGVLALVLFLLAGWMVYERGKSLPQPLTTAGMEPEPTFAGATAFDSTTARRIVGVIERANAAQFAAFQRLKCGVDTEALTDYYTGGELIDLVGFLTTMREKNVRLQEGRSAYQLLPGQTKIESLTPTLAVVTTKESWLLRWWYPDEDDKVFDEVNDHRYTLEYDAGTDRWRIAADQWEGASTPLRIPIEPPPPACGE